MNIYIDCEFNSYKGNLISIALVTEDNREFYEVVPCSDIDEWVIDNVIPVLNKEPIPYHYIQKLLEEFLLPYKSIHIIADWPDDIKYFCDLLITGPGERIDTPPLTLEIKRNIDSTLSKIPHNALEDARALLIADKQ